VNLKRVVPMGEQYSSGSSISKLNEERTGEYYWCDVLDGIAKIENKYNGKIQLVYLDPPFMTGQVFYYKQRVGEQGWRGNDKRFILEHMAYGDKWNDGKKEFLKMMRKVLKKVYDLLSPEGCLYLHIDYRVSAYLKIMLDDIFGEDNFLNEIIWHYQTGGRARKYYSRKHDTILFYSKSRDYYFNPESIGKPRGKEKRNHMKQEIDEEGRVFWSIRSGGRIYKYYEDAKVYPSDVWDDIPHLQQKDPQRTGYDTQKPEALLERIIEASSRPGDLVGDFFAGSGTTLAVAHRLGRNFVGIDSSLFSLHVCRKRLLSQIQGRLAFYYGDTAVQNKEPQKIGVNVLRNPRGGFDISISDYVLREQSGYQFTEKEWIDYWAVGYIEEGFFHADSWEARSYSNPTLSGRLVLQCRQNSQPVIHIVDVLGNQFFYQCDINYPALIDDNHSCIEGEVGIKK